MTKNLSNIDYKFKTSSWTFLFKVGETTFMLFLWVTSTLTFLETIMLKAKRSYKVSYIVLSILASFTQFPLSHLPFQLLTYQLLTHFPLILIIFLSHLLSHTTSSLLIF